MCETWMQVLTLAAICLAVVDARPKKHCPTESYCYRTTTCKRPLHLSSSVAMFESCRYVIRLLLVVLLKQRNRLLQVPSTRKSCVEEAVSSPFRKGSAMAGVGLSLNALKLSACKLPECKSLHVQLYSASQGLLGSCSASSPRRGK